MPSPPVRHPLSFWRLCARSDHLLFLGTNFDAFGTGPTGVSQYLSCAYYPAG